MAIRIMAIYTETLNTNYNFPNIDIYNRYKDGVLCAYRAYPQEGYVIYDPNVTVTETVTDEDGNIVYDDETGLPKEIEVHQYFTMLGMPLHTDFSNFSWVAVPRSEVDENYIFGVDEPEHEIM